MRMLSVEVLRFFRFFSVCSLCKDDVHVVCWVFFSNLKQLEPIFNKFGAHYPELKS